MAKQAVMVQRENDKGAVQGWQGANMEIDPMAGQVVFTSTALLGGKWQITVRPEQVSNFEIIMISDVSTLSMMYGGGLLGWGIAWFMSRWVKMPALKLDQEMAPIGERTVSIRAAGMSPRKLTRKIGDQLADMLRQKGAKIIMPDLTDDTPWKYPWIPTLAGCGIVILAVVAIVVCLVLVGAYN